MSGLTELEKILKKEVAIHTHTANQLIQDPQKVDRSYRIHAETHVPLGDTNSFVASLRRSIVDNKRVMTGGVAGDYGLGKTSLLIHIWSECDGAGIVAVPPFRWDHFSDIFRAIGAWARHKISKAGYDAESRLRAIESRYQESSAEREAERLAGALSADYVTTLAEVNRQISEGSLRLTLSVDDLFAYCTEVCSLLEECGFKGLMVFMDELQHTAEHLSMARLADILFEITSKGKETHGSFGFFFGMPSTTHAAMADVRPDLFQRLDALRTFMNLRTLYGSTFAADLWKGLGKKLQIGEQMNDLLGPYVLDSIAQISDPNRPDIGCGPRTVVSAFKRIAQVGGHEKRAYGVAEFVSDCRTQEVLLSPTTSYIKKLNQVLRLNAVKGNLEESVVVLGGFPSGCSRQVLEAYGLTDQLERLLQQGFQDIVGRNANGYYLIALVAPGTSSETQLDRLIKTYRASFAADNKDIDAAMSAFMKHIVPALFPLETNQWSNAAAETKATWHRFSNGSATMWLRGCFEKDRVTYPNRQLQITVTTKLECQEARVLNEDGAFVGQFAFSLDCSLKNRHQPGLIKRVQESPATYLFRLAMLRPVDSSDLPIFNLVEKQQVTPMFLLGLLFKLDEASLPKSEEGHATVLSSEIRDEIIMSLFSEELSSVQGDEIALAAKGRALVIELVRALCKRAFPSYAPIAPLRTLGKIENTYVKVLNDARITLEAKRGHDILCGDQPDIKERKREISQLFFAQGKYSAAENMLEFGCLLKVSWDKAEVRLQLHPMERQILERLDQCPNNKKVTVDDYACDAIHFSEIMLMFRQQGYCPEEIESILKIGVARKLFNRHPSTRLIFRKPLTLVEWRQELLDSITEIQRKAEQLPGSSPQEFAALENAARGIKTDAEYESVRRKIKTADLDVDGRIVDFIKAAITECEKALSLLSSDLAANERVGGPFHRLKETLTGEVRWVEALNTVRAELVAGVDTLRVKVSKLDSQVAEWKRQDGDRADISGQSDVTKLVEATGTKRLGLKELASDQRKILSGLEADAKCYAAWGTHAGTARSTQQIALAAARLGRPEFRSQVEKLNEAVDNDLRTLKVTALRNHEHYGQQYEEIRSKALAVVGSAREEFQVQRSKLTDSLRAISPKFTSLSAVFQESSPEESHQQLWQEVETALRSVLDELANELVYWRNEALYSKEVLGTQDLEAVDGLLSRLEAPLLSVSGERDLSLKGSADDDRLEDISAYVARTREEIASARQLLREIVNPGEPSAAEAATLRLIADHDMDLKQLILKHFEANLAKMDLEGILDQVKALFRKHRVDIRIRKRR